MTPIVTPDEMRAIDAAATAGGTPVAALIDRAGAAVAREAIRMMGGTYGRTVHVLCGKGNNGADGRVAADVLRQRGVRVFVHDAAWAPPAIAEGHLVIDAAYGTGFRGVWEPPQVGDIPVLAVDIPSGVDAATGAVSGRVLAAARTVTFQALKPGHVLPPGRWLSGEVVVADIGLDTSRARAHVVDAAAVAAWIPQRPVDAHKWHAGVRIVAGSPGMTGAAALAARAAMRSGAGMVHLSAIGALAVDAPIEVVQKPITSGQWASALVQSVQRFHSFVIGPGIGRDDATAEQARQAIVDMPLPAVIDGDGLFALAWSAHGAAALLRSRTLPTVLTPHDGEYLTLAGRAPGADRLAAARSLAGETGAVVLLKGPTTVVASPDGRVFVATNGDQRLATAGTGDVLAGLIGALLARGAAAFEAAAAGAWLHADALRSLPAEGVLASDLIDGLQHQFEVYRR